jgi:hypothetical protein
MRLTNTMKEEIVGTLVNHRFPDDGQVKLERAAKEAVEAYIMDEYGKVGGEKIEGFAVKRKYLTLRKGYEKIRLTFDGPVPVLSRLSTIDYEHSYKEDDLPDCVRGRVAKLRSWIESKNEFKDKMKALMNAVTTDSRLFELIPEAKGIVSLEKSDSTTLVPMDLVNSIRRALAA